MPDVTSGPRRTSPRGHHRRNLILDAAVDLLVERGFGAVSHRSVAERASLPLAATTYYFASLDELLAEAVTRLAESWLRQSRSTVAILPEQLDAAGLLDALIRLTAPTGEPGDSPVSPLTLYERYLEAARHPRLRPHIIGFDEEIETLIRAVLHRGNTADSAENARLVLAVIDGAMLRALAEGLPPGFVRELLAQLLSALSRP